jgi:hypothetical protein
MGTKAAGKIHRDSPQEHAPGGEAERLVTDAAAADVPSASGNDPNAEELMRDTVPAFAPQEPQGERLRITCAGPLFGCLARRMQPGCDTVQILEGPLAGEQTTVQQDQAEPAE